MGQIHGSIESRARAATSYHRMAWTDLRQTLSADSDFVLRPRAWESLNITFIALYATRVIYLAKSLTKTRRAGGSLVVTLPKELVEAQRIKEGEVVEIAVRKLRREGFGTLKGIKPFTAEDELDAHG
jgi:hypothetical protein